MLFKSLLVALLYTSGVLGQRGWEVTYTPERICALERSSVVMRCTYSYPTYRYHPVQKTIWFINRWNSPNEPEDLSRDSEYRGRVEYLGNLKDSCTFRINRLRERDSGTYRFRFLTANDKYTGLPGVSLTVTALQVTGNPGTVTEGQSVRLTCYTPCILTGSPAFIWYRDRAPLSSSDQEHQFIASSENGGMYTCAVKGNEHLPSPGVVLNVRYTPKNVSVSVSPSTVVNPGSSVTLTCVNNANPPAGSYSYTWYKNNEAVNPWTMSGQRLRFNKITASEAGEYSCKAWNEIGSERSPHIDLKVLCFKLEIQPDSVKEGDWVKLTCAKTCYPYSGYHNFQFYKNGQHVSSSYRNGFTARSEDTGNYSCGEYYKRHLSSNVVLLRVKYSPKSLTISVHPSTTILEGSSVTLTCNSDANPPVHTYTWFKNGAVSSETGRPEGSYTIKNVTYQDAGEYYCLAVNEIGKNTSPPERLDVQYSPKNLSVSVHPSNKIVEGSSVTLTCNSHANPRVHSYTWFKKNRAISSETGEPEDSYTIKNITQQDAGEYYCVAVNVIGKNSSHKFLDVQYPPKNTSVSVSPSGELMEGSSVTLTCSSDANPAVQRYTWFKENETGIWWAGSGQSLNFSGITFWSSGLYYCEARNILGAGNCTAVTLKLRYPPKSTSVSVNASGEIEKGSSVTLTCSSNANPPVQNYTWFKNNRAVSSWRGSSHTISNVLCEDSGQYYCKAQNQHGVQDSTAVTIDVQCRSVIVAATVGVLVILAVVFLGAVWVRRRKTTNETAHTKGNREESKGPIYGNVSEMPVSHTETQGTDRGNQTVPLHSYAQPHTHREEELYATVEKPLPECEDDVQYASIQFLPSSAGPRSKLQREEDLCIIYSTVANCNTWTK